MNKYSAGNYRQQQEYKSFTPSFVNHQIAWVNPEIDVLIEQSAKLLGELNAYASMRQDVDFFIPMNIAKEATYSNQIEGIRTELDETLLQVTEINPERRDDWQEVQNYIDAINYAISRLPKLPLSIRLLKEAHKILMSGVRGKHKAPGEIRRSQNWIGGSSLSNAIFVPPSPEELPDLLSDLEKFWHNRSLHLPDLIKIAISHYQFETIHPFLDGNGRCGRLLIVLQLIDANILSKPNLYMSKFFEKHRDTYYNSLTKVRTDNDMEQWILFFLSVMIESAQHGIETYKSFIVLREEYEDRISALGARSKNAQKLLQQMYITPILSARSVEIELEISFSSANRLLKSLEEMGILTQTKGHSQGRLFVLQKYLDLFRS